MPPEPPANGGYMVAAYIVAAVILIGYFVTLVRRGRKALTPPSGTPGSH